MPRSNYPVAGGKNRRRPHGSWGRSGCQLPDHFTNIRLFVSTCRLCAHWSVKIKLMIKTERRFNVLSITLPFFFVFIAASYRGPGEDEEPDHYAERIAFTENSRILGPTCIVVGVIMTLIGLILCWLTRRARQREQTIGFHCPLHGDFYPLSPVTSSRTIGECIKYYSNSSVTHYVYKCSNLIKKIMKQI